MVVSCKAVSSVPRHVFWFYADVLRYESLSFTGKKVWDRRIGPKKREIVSYKDEI